MNATGSGSDVIDLGPDGGFGVIGDNNIGDPGGGNAFGAGHDQITSMGPVVFIVGDSSVATGVPTSAGSDTIRTASGADTIYGDNTDFFVTTTVGTAGGHDNIDSGDGADNIFAGPGHDSMNGGPGAPDVCAGEAGFDSATNCESVPS